MMMTTALRRGDPIRYPYMKYPAAEEDLLAGEDQAAAAVEDQAEEEDQAAWMEWQARERKYPAVEDQAAMYGGKA